ncbi:hypothetical protein VKT23_011462 [Stygiomarasmius scandens]|uniref:Uncharacterized protein n=1 Tax=Marasmiellus scandens TaxID=2682957 RepID=A0ABR1J975_9AGAR
MKGPLDGALANIVSNYCHNLELVTNDQVLLAWSRQKLGELGGGIVVTTSTKRKRLEGYIAAEKLRLSQEDIAAIDAAGLAGKAQFSPKKPRKVKRGAW